jgi:hypothetical protein
MLDPLLASLARPPPTLLPRLAFALAAASVLAWVLGPLGGLSTRPTPAPDGAPANDTGKLFNWHPLLMIVAVCAWSEAALQYVSPAAGFFASGDAVPRSARKLAHACLHGVATLAALGGVAAAWRSHTLKRPDPIPNLYSPHALVGFTTLLAALAQAAIGALSFLWPGAARPHPRAALGAAHAAFGRGILTATAAAAVGGLAEKTAFVQVKGLAGAGLRGAAVALPAAAAVGVVVGAASVAALLAGGGGRGPPEDARQLGSGDEF